MLGSIVISGLGLVLSGIGTAIVLGAKKIASFAVVQITRRGVAAKVFDDVTAAEDYQEKLSSAGHGSIIVQRIPAVDHKGHTYVSLHPVQGMTPAKKMGGLGAAFTVAPPGYWLVKWRAPGSTAEHLEIFQWEREAKERQRDLDQQAVMTSVSMVPRTKRTAHAPVPKKLGSFKAPYDTHEQSQNQMYLTTRFPSPERFERAITGPYPETALPNQGYLPETPLFDSTTSSHMWKTSVIPMNLPKSDPAMDVGYKQPDVLVVKQALQYPEPAQGSSKSGMESELNERTATVTHGAKHSHSGHGASKRVHQPDTLEM
jgi:hypothetical protein